MVFHCSHYSLYALSLVEKKVHFDRFLCFTFSLGDFKKTHMCRADYQTSAWHADFHSHTTCEIRVSRQSPTGQFRHHRTR